MSSTSETTDIAVMGTTADRTLETVRGNLFFVLSRAFSSPTVMEANDPQRLEDLIPALPDSIQSSARSLAVAWKKGLQDRNRLLQSYTRLFLGPFEILAPPYASFYLQDDHQLMGPVSQYVAGAFADAGLEPGLGPREAPDHVSLEFEYLYFLTHQYLNAGDAQWLEQRRTFVTTHVAQWMPLFANAVLRSEEHTFYEMLATILTHLFKETELLC